MKGNAADDKSKRIVQKLLKFGSEAEGTKRGEISFTPCEEANKLINDCYLAFVLGVLFNERRSAEKVWEAPYLLRQRLGGFDLAKIANMSDEEIIKAFEEAGLKYLSRYKRMARWTRELCKQIREKYHGEVENLWSDIPTADKLQARFDEFVGIDQKKASMAVNILVRDFKIEIRGSKEKIDISYDRHVRRIFLRTGLVEKDDMGLLIRVARKLHPEFPGELDYPAWRIGRDWCRPTNPKCKDCFISDVCPKLTHVKETG